MSNLSYATSTSREFQLRHRNPLAHDYVIVSRVVLIGYPQVSDGAKLTYWVIYSHDWYEPGRGGRKGFAFPTIRRLSQLRHTTERTIQRHLTELIAARLLTREFRPGQPSVLYIEEPSQPEIEQYLAEEEGGDIPVGGGVSKMSPQKPEEEKQINSSVNGDKNLVMEERRTHESGLTPIGRLLPQPVHQPGRQSDRVQWLAEQMIEQTGDHQSPGCYKVIARRCSESLIFEALALLKEARQEGGVRNRGAYFVALVRRLCAERHLADPLPGKVAVNGARPVADRALGTGQIPRLRVPRPDAPGTHTSAEIEAPQGPSRPDTPASRRNPLEKSGVAAPDTKTVRGPKWLMHPREVQNSRRPVRRSE